MSTDKKRSRISFIVSLAVAAIVLLFLIFFYKGSDETPQGGNVRAPEQSGEPQSAQEPAGRRAPQSAPAAAAGNGKGPVLNPVPGLPEDMKQALNNPPPELPPDLKAQLTAPPPELPEDLKRQLNSPPPELPPDLKAQLNAPKPELPEDIKRALQTPPRIVTLDEVNTPPK